MGNNRGCRSAAERVQYGVMIRYAVLLLVCCLISAPVGAQVKSAGSLVAARAAVLMDRQSGLVLWSQNPDLELPMASTTKVMTAIVILDRAADRLDEKTRVSEHAFSVGGSSQFAAGDIVTLYDLLTAALVKSSNEATVAAAEFIAGDEQTFISWMNDKAKALGLRHTHFTSPHGFTKPPYAPDHYSCARDMAIIARAATAYPQIRALVNTVKVTVTAEPRGSFNLFNTNKALHREVPGVPGARVDGMKTGYIKESGRCYIGTATQNNWQLIAVILNSPDPIKDAMTLFQHGFTHFAWKTYASATQSAATVPVGYGSPAQIPLGTAQPLGAPLLKLQFGGDAVVDQVKYVNPSDPLCAPIKRGAVVGKLVLLRNGAKIAEAPAVALEASDVAWWARTGVILCYFGGFAVLIVVGNVIYGTRTKNARRRRRELASGLRSAD